MWNCSQKELIIVDGVHCHMDMVDFAIVGSFCVSFGNLYVMVGWSEQYYVLALLFGYLYVILANALMWLVFWLIPMFHIIFLTFLAHHCVTLGVFGLKEVGGSKEMRKYNCSLSYLSKHRKRKIKKLLFLFSFLFYTTISSLLKCYS